MNNPARRRFITTLAATGLGLAPLSTRASATETRFLRFDNLHTSEKLSVEYFVAGRYLDDGLSAINHVLRDFRTNDIGTIDPALLDLLHALAISTGNRQPFQVISGYRSPATNEALRQRSNGVASGSLHLRGQAIDIRMPGLPLTALRDAALSLRAGGVGYYAASNFVHVDTGRVRAW